MQRTPLKLVALATSCVVVGGGATAIVNASAADSSKSKPAAKTAKAKKQHRRGALLGRAVHGDLTVPTKTGFATVTIDRGFVKAISGNQVVISESTKKQAGKVVTVTVPAGAKVFDNRKPAQLSDVKVGQHIGVMQLPKRTVVRVHDPK